MIAAGLIFILIGMIGLFWWFIPAMADVAWTMIKLGGVMVVIWAAAWLVSLFFK